MKSIKIACIVGGFPSMSETFVVKQITGLIDLGHRVDIYSFNLPREDVVQPDVVQYGLLKNVRYIPHVPKNKWHCRLIAAALIFCRLFCNPAYVLKVLKYLLTRPAGFSYPVCFFVLTVMRKKYDLIHCHFGNNGILAIELNKAGLKTPVLTTFHGQDTSSFPARYGSQVYRELFEYGQMFTANTSFTRQRLIELGCPSDKIHLLPMGINPGDFPFSARHFDPQMPLTLLTVARLVEKKGHRYAISAMARLKQKRRNFRYIIVGQGPLERELKSLAEELGLSDYVFFAGAADSRRVMEHYRNAHVFILPSVTSSLGDMEGQGLVLQEAQASGLPVISTIHNGIPEGVLDGVSGFLVPEKDDAAMAEKIEYFILHPELLPQMGRAGSDFVRSKYDIRVLNRQLADIYERLLCSGSELAAGMS